MTLAIVAETDPLKANEDGVILIGKTRVTLDTVVAVFKEGAVDFLLVPLRFHSESNSQFMKRYVGCYSGEYDTKPWIIVRYELRSNTPYNT